MSDVSGRTLLSLWGIKAPTTPNVEPDPPPEANESLASSSSMDSEPDEKRANSVDRAKAASQWSSIFSRPKKDDSASLVVEKGEASSTQADSEPDLLDDDEPLTQTTISDGLQSEDNSFIQTLQVSPSELARFSSASSAKTVNEERPTFLHVLRADPEKLRAIKPRLHSFFAKRVTSVPKRSVSPKPLRPLAPQHAPWSVVHIRPEHTSFELKYRAPLVKRRKLCDAPENDMSFEWASLAPPLHFERPKIELHKPNRALYAAPQITALAALSKSKQNGEHLDELIKRSGEPKPFDYGSFEGSMWCDKYAPQTPFQHLQSAEAKKLKEWVSKQIRKPQKQRQWPPKRKKRNLDDFVVEDSEDEEAESEILVLHGPNGSGKTSAVYAAARAVDAFVFEVNCSMKRTGKELSSLLDGISHNHAVHNAKNVIILIDDGDIVFENESGGFWSTLARYAVTSRRPVVITCRDPNRIALADVAVDRIQFPMPNLVRVTDTAWTIALSEGYIISKSDVAKVVVTAAGDMRRVLSHLQLWCQMGVGGLPSGIDWYPKEHEFRRTSTTRVLSGDTWCPSLQEEKTDMREALPPVSDSPTLNSLTSCAATAMEFSEIDAAYEPYLIESRSVPEETVSSSGSIVLSHWRVPALRLYPATSYLERNPDSHLQRTRDIFADEYAIGTTQDATIATDIAPYMREIVACDFQRALIMEQSLAQNRSAREMRMTRRMWAASGIDSRQYMGYSASSMRLILSTCLPAELFVVANSDQEENQI